MPGRQSTGPATQKPSKPVRRKRNRALDAFAIARHEIPARVGVRKSRLGNVEQEGTKRRRGNSEEGSEGEGHGPQSKKTRRGDKDKDGNEIEGGSDSEGNEWITGAVGNDDDSSLDSDEAMGESNEENFKDSKFRGSSSAKGRKRGAQPTARHGLEEDDVDLDEGDDRVYDSDEESEDFAAGAVDLATALEQSSGDEQEHIGKRSGRAGAAKNIVSQSAVNESDEAHDTDITISDPEDDQHEKYSALRSFISSMGNDDPSKKAARSQLDLAQEALPPSDYGVNPKQKLTIAELLPTVTDPIFRKSLKLMADDGKKPSKLGNGIPGKLSVPLAKRRQDRLDRAAAFERSKETLNRWIDTVKHNRRAEHLMFPLPDPDAESAKNNNRLQSVTHPGQMTDLESTIQDLLVQSGLAANGKGQEKEIQKLEELATNDMPIEEVRARRAELRRARELLFREEIRAKRIKKIKSKSYRRVHRKERERNLLRDKEALAAAGVVSSEDEQDRLDRQRAEERMSQKHRESRWAKSVKATGRAAWDENAREGATDMARREEELRRRMQGKEVRDEGSLGSESESSDNEQSDDDDEAFAARMREKLDKVKDNQKDDPGSRLSSLKFMKKAEAARKARNDEAVEQLRREMDGKGLEDDDDSEDEGEAQGRRRYGPPESTTQASEPVNKTVNEFEERFDSDQEDGPAVVLADEPEEIEVTTNKPFKEAILPTKPSQQRKKAPQISSKEKSDVSENPWLVVPKKSSKMKPSADDSIIISTIPQLSSKNSEPSRASKAKEPTENGVVLHEESDDSDASFSGFSPQLPSKQLRNQDLIRQAFAADDVLAEETFAAEKAALAADEEPSKPVSNALPGWGTWVGPGLSKKDKCVAKRAPTANGASSSGTSSKLPSNRTSEGVPAEKRADRKLQKVIISEKRMPKSAKFLASSLPHPFETRAQYERSLRLPMGPEFTTKQTFQGMTKPRVLTKPGVIAPMRKPLM